MKFEQIHYDYDSFTGKKLHVIETITVETEAVELGEILDAFERFLKACSFHLNGKLDIVEVDDV